MEGLWEDSNSLQGRNMVSGFYYGRAKMYSEVPQNNNIALNSFFFFLYHLCFQTWAQLLQHMCFLNSGHIQFIEFLSPVTCAQCLLPLPYKSSGLGWAHTLWFSALSMLMLIFSSSGFRSVFISLTDSVKTNSECQEFQLYIGPFPPEYLIQGAIISPLDPEYLQVTLWDYPGFLNTG